jgi:putative flavoprotein involved in K+ transport
MSAELTPKITNNEETFHTIVIGGGQAGLSAGYFLKLRNENFVILDEPVHTGDSWRKRWDSLRLFTPGKFNSLPGAPFSKPGDYFPTKNEVADYLEEYARQFNLPVRHGVKVGNLSGNDHGYHITAGASRFFTTNVIIATGPYQLPNVPKYAGKLDSAIFQLHSSEYRNPEQIQSKSVLIVGAGNSGAEIAIELGKAGKQVWLAGRDVGRLPLHSPLGKVFNGMLIWWIMRHILTLNTPLGRRMWARVQNHGVPLGLAQRREIVNSGVELTSRLSGIQSGKPQIEDGRILPVDGVIWATGFRPDHHWINLPIFDEHGATLHSRGLVSDAPGLYFLGLPFQTGLSSSLLGGVGADAAYIVSRIPPMGIPA